MSWTTRLKLEMLRVVDSEGLDGLILSRDICARLGLPRDLCDDMKTKEAVKMFRSAASAEGYIDAQKELGFFTWRDGFIWRRIGHCLVFLHAPLHVPFATPHKCIVRTAESIWKLYDFSSL